MRMKWFMVVLGLVLIVSALTRTWHRNATSERVWYSGEAIFAAQEDYTAFKSFVLSPRVEVIHMSALSSDPPIWVRYHIEADRNAGDYLGLTKMSGALPLVEVICIFLTIACGVLMLLLGAVRGTKYE